MPDDRTPPTRRGTSREWLGAWTDALDTDQAAGHLDLHELLEDYEANFGAPLVTRAGYIAAAALHRRQTEERLLRAEERIAELADRLEKLEEPSA